MRGGVIKGGGAWCSGGEDLPGGPRYAAISRPPFSLALRTVLANQLISCTYVAIDSSSDLSAVARRVHGQIRGGRCPFDAIGFWLCRRCPPRALNGSETAAANLARVPAPSQRQ